MKLHDTEPLARDLEHGLGEVLPFSAAFAAPLRLRTGVCAVTSIAIAEHFLSRGIPSQVVSSQPHLDIDPTLDHKLVLAHFEGETTVIDPTYTQFLKYAGLDPSYVEHGGLNTFPRDKIASFSVGGEKEIVTQLSLISEYFMDRYVPIEDPPYYSGHSMGFAGMNDEQIEARLSEIWNPANWRQYQPSHETYDAGVRLSQFILPGHVQLVA